jgi:hypothetical protein
MGGTIYYTHTLKPSKDLAILNDLQAPYASCQLHCETWFVLDVPFSVPYRIHQEPVQAKPATLLILILILW